MKSVLISVQPKWCRKITHIIGKKDGTPIYEKTVEIRKTKPKIDTPFKCYIYETKGLYKGAGGCLFEGIGKVIGEFVCDKITNFESEFWDDETFERIQEFVYPWDYDREYGEKNYKTVATNDSDNYTENWLCKQSCLSWEELRKYIGTGIKDFFGWHISNLVIYEKPKELIEFSYLCKKDCDTCKYNKLNPWANLYEPVMMCQRDVSNAPQSWCYVEGIKCETE